MDNSKNVTSISLCTGYGGIELGLKRVIPALRTVAYVEREGFAIGNLVSKIETGQLDNAPVWTDVKTFPSEAFRDRIHIITAGYPCQPFSHAGIRKGKDDPRHLWPYIRSIVGSIRPVQCFFENVEGHITLGLSTVISDLAELGYKVSWGIFSASEVGAPHQRKRVFILADSCREGLQRGEWADSYGEQGTPAYESTTQRRYLWPARPGEEQYEWEPPRTVADTCRFGQRRRREDVEEHRGGSGTEDQTTGSCSTHNQPDEQSEVKSKMGRSFDEFRSRMVRSTNRVDELRLIGNGVVPATAERAYRILTKEIGINGI